MKHAFLALFLSFEFLSQAQITQNIKGKVLDFSSESPLIGVLVDVYVLDQKYSSITDENGFYLIESVPIGRVSMTFSYIGYESTTRNNLELLSGKELVVNVKLEESIEEGEEVVVIAQRDTRTRNDNVSVSGRQFSIEESKRYAGVRNDVARMAQNFAGVQGSDDARNDIVVRGNSPIGVLFRMEGVDIPNPNHFSASGTTGGPVSMLNNNVLENSDFLTGAFPAEYGNALAATFDLQMRNGNKDKHEFLGQVGFNGLELMAEGPLVKNKNHSFLISYRYSTLQLFNLLGVNFGTGTSVPNYEDLNFKLNFQAMDGKIIAYKSCEWFLFYFITSKDPLKGTI